mgnify:CR=1 FL=1
MTTVRQIERQWRAKQFDRLLRAMLQGRPEALVAGQLRLVPAAAAMTMIRLDELAQSHVGLYPRLIRTLLQTQDPDGGWGDAMTTALCVRALLLGDGHGIAIAQGIAYLATLQKDDGAWPAVPIRRTSGDVATTAMVLGQLADQPEFRAHVRVDDARTWLASQRDHTDPLLHPLVDRAMSRYRLRPMFQQQSLVWS